MKRQKKFKKIRLTDIFRNLKDSVIKKAYSVFVAVLFIILAAILVRAFLYRSDYFRMRSVDTKDIFLERRDIVSIENQLMGLFKGRSVFSINLQAVGESLQRSYPEAKGVTVRIALPDKLVVSMKFRRPIAYVNSGRMYTIDQEGVVIPASNVNIYKNLPLIEGVKVNYNMRANRLLVSGNMKSAIELLREIKRSRFISDYGVESVNASDAKKMSFILKNGIEVRIGCENIEGRLEALERTLKDPRLIMDRIKYIDVRYKDIVIGPKE